MEMSSAFHFFSLAVTAWALWRLARYQGDLRLLRDLLGHTRRVYVDVPARFLKKFCRALGISYKLPENNTKNSMGALCRIDPAALIELHWSQGISQIQWTEAHALRIELRSVSRDDLEHWRMKIGRSLGASEVVIADGASQRKENA